MRFTATYKASLDNLYDIILLMGNLFNKLTEDRLVGLGIRLNLLLWAIGFFLLFFFWRWLPPQVPLYYSHPWGESQLTSPTGLLLLPFLSLLIFILNFAIILKTIREERFIAQLLVGAGVTFAFLCIVALYRIITLVT